MPGEIIIKSFLPNPEGKDAQGEWVEIANIGSSTASLEGWHLAASGKKEFLLSGFLLPGEARTYARSETKLSLSNTNGFVALFDQMNTQVSRLSFSGAAPSGAICAAGRSPCFTRAVRPRSLRQTPAPGVQSLPKEYSEVGTARAGSGMFPVFVSAISCAFFLCLLFGIFYAKSNDLSQLFFGRNE